MELDMEDSGREREVFWWRPEGAPIKVFVRAWRINKRLRSDDLWIIFRASPLLLLKELASMRDKGTRLKRVTWGLDWIHTVLNVSMYHTL